MSANQERRSVPVVKDKKVLPSLISPICFVVALRESPTGFFVAASYPVDKANRLSLAAKVN